MQENTVTAKVVNDQSHLVFIVCDWYVSFDLSGEIRRGNLTLPNGHMAHLWSVEVYAVADRIYSIVTDNTHGRIDSDVSVKIGCSHVRRC